MTVPHIPGGYHTVVPYLIAADAKALCEFIERAFDAEVHHKIAAPDGTVQHADLVVEGSHVMIGQSQEGWPPIPAAIYLYVKDCDRVYATALEAGAESVMPPGDQFYGDRHGGVRDPQGNMWFMATHIEDISDEELHRRAAAHKPSP